MTWDVSEALRRYGVHRRAGESVGEFWYRLGLAYVADRSLEPEIREMAAVCAIFSLQHEVAWTDESLNLFGHGVVEVWFEEESPPFGCWFPAYQVALVFSYRPGELERCLEGWAEQELNEGGLDTVGLLPLRVGPVWMVHVHRILEIGLRSPLAAEFNRRIERWLGRTDPTPDQLHALIDRLSQARR
ncbi:hypothetical protein [Amycolatopsis anabasis]|uniref:hypothetical protein n=1 Tax=Amycolatopsis anabasis TaxID=1840409 RepID=UPI00131C99A7|nr:hypothetical protein [Amycolatopsis anabasis]